MSDEVAMPESQQMFLKGAWKSAIRAEGVDQSWYFEFTQLDGLYVDMSYTDFNSESGRAGAQRLKLEPVVVAGRFMGFAGSDGLFRYRFTHLGEDLRIDVSTPPEGLAEANFPLFAAPVLKRSAASPPPAPAPELTDQFRRNIKELAWPVQRPAREVVGLMNVPGHWYGLGTKQSRGVTLTMEWRIKFVVTKFGVQLEIETSDNIIGSRDRDVVPLFPTYDGDQFMGVGGHFRELSGQTSDYLFTMSAPGHLRMTVLYTVSDTSRLKFDVGLTHRLGKF